MVWMRRGYKGFRHALNGSQKTHHETQQRDEYHGNDRRRAPTFNLARLSVHLRPFDAVQRHDSRATHHATRGYEADKHPQASNSMYREHALACNSMSASNSKRKQKSASSRYANHSRGSSAWDGGVGVGVGLWGLWVLVVFVCIGVRLVIWSWWLSLPMPKFFPLKRLFRRYP
jgi:hypothetical protein